eukprot:4642128-Alexandrium_andersonii.AAC.1
MVGRWASGAASIAVRGAASEAPAHAPGSPAATPGTVGHAATGKRGHGLGPALSAGARSLLRRPAASSSGGRAGPSARSVASAGSS